MKKTSHLSGKKPLKKQYLLFIIMIAAMIFIPNRNISVLLFIGIAILFYYIFIFKNAKGKILICGKCGHEMSISTLKYLNTFHEGNSYYKECNKCGYKEAHLKDDKS